MPDFNDARDAISASYATSAVTVPLATAEAWGEYYAAEQAKRDIRAMLAPLVRSMRRSGFWAAYARASF